MASFNKVHVLIGTNKKSCIIGFYLDNFKVKQMYMFEDIPLKQWFPRDSKYWRHTCKAKVTVSKLY